VVLCKLVSASSSPKSWKIQHRSGDMTSLLKYARIITVSPASCHWCRLEARCYKIASLGHLLQCDWPSACKCCWYMDMGPSNLQGWYIDTTCLLWLFVSWICTQHYQPRPIGLLPSHCVWWNNLLVTRRTVPLGVKLWDSFYLVMRNTPLGIFTPALCFVGQVAG